MNIGKAIAKRRKELDLTLEEVGNAVGVGKSTVRKWETGDIKNMKRDKIALLASVLKMNPADFIGDCAVPPSFKHDTLPEPHLTPDEHRLIHAYRAADTRAREDALHTLLSHPKKQDQANLA